MPILLDPSRQEQAGERYRRYQTIREGGVGIVVLGLLTLILIVVIVSSYDGMTWVLAAIPFVAVGTWFAARRLFLRGEEAYKALLDSKLATQLPDNSEALRFYRDGEAALNAGMEAAKAELYRSALDIASSTPDSKGFLETRRLTLLDLRRTFQDAYSASAKLGRLS